MSDVANALLLLIRFQTERLQLIGHKPNAIAVGAAEDESLASHFDAERREGRLQHVMSDEQVSAMVSGEDQITTVAGCTINGLPVRVEGKTGVHVEYLGFSRGPF